MERIHKIPLTQPQQVAQKLGGVSFRCYECSTCSDATNPYVTLSYFSNSDRYQSCPHCHELTVIRTKETIEKATKYSSGKLLIEEKCHYCDYQTKKTKTIPRLSSSSRSSSNHHYHSSGSSSGGFSGGSDGGGSFGGGGSDGGGAGGGW